MRPAGYETLVPSRFVLDDGRVMALSAKVAEEALSRETCFLLYVPPNNIDDVYSHLKREGFEDVTLSICKGEKYSVRLPLTHPWELHIRLYDNGFIESEVEIQREYLEHLERRRINVVYEPFQWYNDIYDRLHIFYRPERRWVIGVREHLRVKLNPPQELTPWVYAVAGAVVIGLLTYCLYKLERPRESGSV